MTSGKRETILALIYSSFSKVVTYLLLLVFANLYSQTDYGVGSFALNIRNLIMFFAFIGIPDALVPLIVKKKKINSVLVITIIASCILTIIGLFGLVQRFWLWPLVITFPLVMFTSIATAFWRANARYDAPNRAGLTSIVLTLIAAFLLKDYGRFGVISSYALGNLYTFLVLVYPVRKELFNSIKGKFNIKETATFFKAGLIVTAISGLFMLLVWINSTLLGFLGNYAEVARFGIASAISGVILIIPTSLSLFMVTRASQISNKNKALNVLHRVVRVSFFASLISSSLLVAILPFLMKIFFKKYVGIEFATSLMIMGTIFFSSYYIIYSYYIGIMKAEKALLPIIIGFIVNIILALVLIPKFSLIGVSLAMALAHLSILLIIARNERMKRIGIMSIIAIPVIYLSSLNSYLGIAIFILIIPISLVSKIITREDIKVIREAIFKNR